MKQAAVFLDRDNTLIEDPGYLSDPDRVTLLPGVGQAIRRWNESGYKVVLVTNQSGLARGLITETQLEDIHAQLELLLEAQNARLDAVYFCPYLDSSEAVVPKYRRDSSLRKPKPGMLLKAAEDLDLDLDYSWMVGDSEDDVQAGQAAGCKTVMLSDASHPPAGARADFVVQSLVQAAELVLDGNSTTTATPADVDRHLVSPDTAAPARQDGVMDVLKDIRALMQQQRRDQAQRDFSLSRLGATLLQLLAVSILLWALAAFVGDEPITALPRLALAGVVQLSALTLYIIDRSN